jgi:hypothetical protein
MAPLHSIFGGISHADDGPDWNGRSASGDRVARPAASIAGVWRLWSSIAIFIVRRLLSSFGLSRALVRAPGESIAERAGNQPYDVLGHAGGEQMDAQGMYPGMEQAFAG